MEIGGCKVHGPIAQSAGRQGRKRRTAAAKRGSSDGAQGRPILPGLLSPICHATARYFGPVQHGVVRMSDALNCNGRAAGDTPHMRREWRAHAHMPAHPYPPVPPHHPSFH
ncbi:hypothetical protein MTO96_013324 [Rhipicephalus appendiculatus]